MKSIEFAIVYSHDGPVFMFIYMGFVNLLAIAESKGDGVKRTYTVIIKPFSGFTTSIMVGFCIYGCWGIVEIIRIQL